jgi:hypothetical protein
MTHYFFDIRDGNFMPDEIGLELPNLAAARVEAVAFAGAMIAGDPAKFLHVEVHEGDGLVLFTFAFVATNAPEAMLLDTPRAMVAADRSLGHISTRP